MRHYRWFGTQQSRWQTVPIRRVCRLGTGHTPNRAEPDYWREEDCVVPWVTVADIHRLHGLGLTPLEDTEQHISEVGLANSAAVLHPPGTVMVSRTASIGFACRIAKPMATTQAFATWTPGPAVDSRYLLLVIKALAPEFDRLAYGSTHLTIYMPDIESISMPLPPLAVQRAIAEYLHRETGRIDALMAAKRRMMELLLQEEQRMLLNLIGDWRSEQTWSLRQSGTTVLTGPFGTQLAAAEYVHGGFPVVNPTHISGTGKIVPDSDVSVSESVALRLSRHRLRQGDIVMGRKGDVGRSAVVIPEQEGWLCGSDSIAIRTDPARLSSQFLAMVLHVALYKQQLDACSTGAMVANINESTLLDFRTPRLSLARQKVLLRDVDRKMSVRQRVSFCLASSIDLLQERRQALVTAAVTGQLDIPEAA